MVPLPRLSTVAGHPVTELLLAEDANLIEALDARIDPQRPVGHLNCTVKSSPCDEGPRGAVPKAAQQHRDHQIAVHLDAATAIAAEADVKIVAQPQ